MKKLALLVFSFVFLAGCMVGPNYHRPPVSVPPTYRGATPAPAKSLGSEKWWEEFQDPALGKLIHTAIVRNYDVQIAATRVVEAQAALSITRANQFPTASLGAGLFTEQNPKISKVFPAYEVNAGRLNLSAIWDLDFWGKYRREKRARQDSLRMTLVLEKHGSASLLDVSQAQQLVDAAEEEIPNLDREIEQQENLLSILLGENPGPIARGRPLTEQPAPRTVPAGLPSELLERRPDILEAEDSLIAANAQIGVLKASLFPDISLTGTGGLESFALNRFITAPSETWNAAVNITQPVFEAGALRAGVKLAQAQRKQMLLTDQQTILNAFEQVSDALVGYRKDREFLRQQERLTAAAGESDRLSMVLYRHGGASYLQVLTSETNYFAAELNLVQAQLNERLELVQLYQALGGGWQP